MPGSMGSVAFAAAPNAAGPASRPTWLWPPPSSPSALCCGPPGTATAGTPDHDHPASADLLADALSQALGKDGTSSAVETADVLLTLRTDPTPPIRHRPS